MVSMTQEMSQSADALMPKKGDHFRCEKCGMEMEIITGCKCKDPEHVHFQCCGSDMEKV